MRITWPRVAGSLVMTTLLTLAIATQPFAQHHHRQPPPRAIAVTQLHHGPPAPPVQPHRHAAGGGITARHHIRVPWIIRHMFFRHHHRFI